jgi:signal transduction histidine kinase
MPDWLRRFPGAVLKISRDGTVVASNGRLDRELGTDLTGTRFEEVLDLDSSGAKWRRVLAGAPEGGGPEAEASPVELILRGTGTLPEPRPFAVLRDEEAAVIWLLDLRSDPRLTALRDEVTGINSELTSTQRELLKERGRLSRALSALEEQYAEAERLARTVQVQNDLLEEQNRELQLLTEQLRARGAELERSNRDLDEFAHVISHDLKAPLRSVASYASWLQEDLEPVLTDESREHLQRLGDRSERMKAMIDGVLEYARAGRERARPVPVDVEDLLRSVLALLGPPSTARVEIGTPMPTLETARSPLQQVFLNLLSNALRFAPPGNERIRVECREVEDGYEFTVSDNGPGIPPASRDRIWTLFHTLAADGAAPGTGIGLAVVRRLVEAQGGRITVESEAGSGATFRFLWPAVQPEAE